MRVLIVKTSSMGDVIHTLPALTDAVQHYPDISFDWVVEESFAEIPSWHVNVNRVIPVALRRWRKNVFKYIKNGEIKAFLQDLRKTQYDLIIDAQGLLKSAVYTKLARGTKLGLDKHSARESLASMFYQKKISVDSKQHAITRTRELFSKALDYPLATSTANYGVDKELLQPLDLPEPYVIFLHGTTWDTKHWPEVYWQALAKLVNQAGYHVCLPWGNDREKQRAEKIAGNSSLSHVLPKLNLKGMSRALVHAKAVVTVDTGLAHLAAALDVPSVSLYGPTDPQLTGTQGAKQNQLQADFSCSPCLSKTCLYTAESEVQPACFAKLPSDLVWQQLKALLDDVSIHSTL